MKQEASPFSVLPLKFFLIVGMLGLSLLFLLSLKVFLKYKVRSLHAAVQTLEKKRFKLNVEWSQLILEKSTWCATSRVDGVARGILKMHTPTQEQLRILKL